MGRTTIRRDLLDSIIRSPGDDQPRLAYAVELEKQGDKRGEFIRIQCELAQTAKHSNRAKYLRRRERELLANFGRKWVDDLTALGASVIAFQRGFPEEIRISASDLQRNAYEISRITPVTLISLSDVAGEGLIRIYEAMTEDEKKSIDSNPSLGRLFARAREQPAGDITMLSHLPFSSSIRTLDLSSCNLDDADIKALSEITSFSSLARLDLTGNRFGDTGATQLGLAPFLKSLKDIRLGHNRFRAAGLASLIAGLSGGSIRTLSLENNYLGNEGIAFLANTLDAPELRDLSLRANAIGEAGVSALKEASFFKNLRKLDLSDNQIEIGGGGMLPSRLFTGKIVNLDGNPGYRRNESTREGDGNHL